MSADKPRDRHKFVEISPVVSRWLEHNAYPRAFEQDVMAEIAQESRILATECDGGFEVSFRKIRRAVVVRVVVCIEEDEYSYYVRWIHDFPA